MSGKLKSIRAVFKNKKETLMRTAKYEGLNKDIVFDLQIFGYSERFDEMWIKINGRKVFQTKDIKKYMEENKSDTLNKPYIK